MKTYTYKCLNGHYLSSNLFARLGAAHPDPCPDCGHQLHRAAIVNIARGFQPHYNNAVGKFVHTEGEFRSELGRAAQEQHDQTGAGSDYVMVDAADVPATSEGLEEGAKARRDSGEDLPVKKIIT